MFLYVVYLYQQNKTTMRKNAKRINDLRIELINEIKNFVFKQGERLQFTTHFNIGVDEIEFEDDYQRIIKRADSITNDGYVFDEEGTEVSLQELDIVELGFILDELEENKFEIF